MKHWIYKLKTWFIHTLGGYTADEATPNRKIVRLCDTRGYPTNTLGNELLRKKGEAARRLARLAEDYVSISERREVCTGDWVIRASLRVVDEDLF